MPRALLLSILLVMSACIVYVTPDDHTRSYSYEEVNVWLENASIQCDYDWENESSTWRLLIYADSYYGPGEVEHVYFMVEYSTTYYMYSQGLGLWEKAFHSYTHQCHEYIDFEFVARDYNGNEAYYLLAW